MVEAAKSLGVAFVGYGGEDSKKIQIQTCTKLRTFTLEDTIEFTSARKRQTVILRDEKGLVFIEVSNLKNRKLYCISGKAKYFFRKLKLFYHSGTT